jgi:hypothetical protein
MVTYTNRGLADALELSESTASRMRSAKRTGSVKTLNRIAKLTGRSLEEVVLAAEKARGGDLEKWADLLSSAVSNNQGQ